LAVVRGSYDVRSLDEVLQQDATTSGCLVPDSPYNGQLQAAVGGDGEEGNVAARHSARMAPHLADVAADVATAAAAAAAAEVAAAAASNEDGARAKPVPVAVLSEQQQQQQQGDVERRGDAPSSRREDVAGAADVMQLARIRAGLVDHEGGADGPNPGVVLERVISQRKAMAGPDVMQGVSWELVAGRCC
jgi:cell pole-organizing protein PopZ